MNTYVTGQTIRELREKKRLTQLRLAEMISVSDKTVSKWETGRGLPDITLLEPLAKALGVSVAGLLSGSCASNTNLSANMLRSCFYVCPVCGNVIHSMGSAHISCCGVTLPAVEADEDADGMVKIEKIDNEYYVTADHPMTKEHYISWMAMVSSDRAELVKLYPEGSAAARFTICSGGYIYVYCNRHGAVKVKSFR